MKYVVFAAAALTLSACAGVQFSKQVVENGQLKTTEDTGLPFYQSKPYLLVTRSGAKDGGVESKIIYLPDLTTTYFAKATWGIGSNQLAIALADGRIVSFNQTTDSKIPELLANLASPLKGLGDASSAFATAGLTQAQEDKLRAEMKATADAKNTVVTATSAVKALGVVGASICLAKPVPPSSYNAQLNLAQAGELVGALIDLACGLERYKVAGTNAGEAAITQALGSVAVVLDKDFPQSTLAQALVILDKHPTASALRAAVAPLKDFDITPTDPPPQALHDIETSALTAAKRVTAIADVLDPPKTPGPQEPFALYEFVVNGQAMELRKVEPKKAS